MTTSAADPTTTEPSPTWRVAPSVPVAIGVFIAYVVVFIGLTATAGIDYADWFATSANAFRTAVIPLIGGSLVLIAFVLWARWDWVFKDPARLPMSGLLWVPVAIFAVGIVAHLAIADWADTPTDLLLAIVAAGVLVGFAEETLFRGIILRSLRTNLRPEAWVMLISSVWFGFFHLTNLRRRIPGRWGAPPVRPGLRGRRRALPVPPGAWAPGGGHDRARPLGHVGVPAAPLGHDRRREPGHPGPGLRERRGRRDHHRAPGPRDRGHPDRCADPVVRSPDGGRRGPPG